MNKHRLRKEKSSSKIRGAEGRGSADDRLFWNAYFDGFICYSALPMDPI